MCRGGRRLADGRGVTAGASLALVISIWIAAMGFSGWYVARWVNEDLPVCETPQAASPGLSTLRSAVSHQPTRA